MSELEPGHEAIAASLTRRLHGYAQGLGLDDRAVRQIVEAVIAAMPSAEDVDQLAVARNWMLQAAR
ncbi:hypothetical protein [Methylobacterium longum]|uniref:Uncharacterized protein n=1 Tax=Methylobacterium longum TaxID=767694 RepID=A0ABT8ASS0_9HYPH|nr:hypothetical protein [Methylobacterium longum]MDN3572962.1 hypothetical protein [Methylobacterium longum]GJE14555.1 hypothetical protein FOHLNKBM_5630 [Methylobacterium longum]